MKETVLQERKIGLFISKLGADLANNFWTNFNPSYCKLGHFLMEKNQL
jgi:hypothetical protein